MKLASTSDVVELGVAAPNGTMGTDHARDISAGGERQPIETDHAQAPQQHEVRGLAMREPATILLLAASPLDTVRLRLDREVHEIEQQIRLARFRDSIRLISRWAVRPDDLLSALNETDPDVLHFAGHGNPQSVLLEDHEGYSDEVTTEVLSRVVHTARSMKLLVLNSCYSKLSTHVFKKSSPCAIGMGAAIDDTSAIRYAAALYGALAFGRSVADAHEQGCISLAMGHRHDEGIPHLTCRDGVDASRVFLVRSMIPGFNSDSSQQAEFLKKIMRRDNLIPYLPDGLAREISELIDSQKLLMILASARSLLQLIGKEPASFAVLPGEIPLNGGSQYAWFSTLQIAAMKNPMTLGSILLKVRSETALSLPLCEQVLALLCQKPEAP